MTMIESEKPVANTRKQISLPPLRSQQLSDGTWRISAVVEGAELFFESLKPLSPRPEILACAFLLPAMARGHDLHFGGHLSASLLENLSFIQNRAIEWWPWLSRVDVHALPAPDDGKAENSSVFYTGGVDSSYALQKLHSDIRYMIFVEGFDVPLADLPRIAGVREWLTATAEACGVELIVVQTNLKTHPLFVSAPWEISHIAALSAVAHALGDHAGTVYVAASDVPPPWGSAPDLDCRWSTGSVEIVNFSHEISRLARVESIANWAPLRGRLRVCWENLESSLNCGYCEKCVRTRAQLVACGAAAELDSFPKGNLAWQIRRMPAPQHELHGQWREVASRIADPTIRVEIERMLNRSTSEPIVLLYRIVRKIRRMLRGKA